MKSGAVATPDKSQRIAQQIARASSSRMAWHIFALALMVRLVALIVADVPFGGLQRGFFTDAGREYASMAHGLLTRGDFTLELLWRHPMPSAYQPPLYALFLALVFHLRNVPFLAILNDPTALLCVQFLHCLAGAFWCVMLYSLGRQLFGQKIGSLAALIGAIYPTLVYSVVEVHPLNFFLVMLLGFLIAACHFAAVQKEKPSAWRKKGWWLALVLGSTSGLLALTRSECLPLCLLIVSGLACQRPSAWKQLAIAGLICCLLYAPWLIRNHRDFGALVLTNTSGTNLLRGQGPDANGGTHLENGEEIWFSPDLRASKDALPITRDWELREDTMMRRAAMDYIRQHPFRPLQLVPNKLLFFLVRDPYHPKGRVALVWVPGLLLLLCALRGYWLLRSQFILCWPLIAVPLFYVLIVLVFFSLPRYRMMIDPVLMVPAACGLCPTCIRNRTSDV